MSKKEIIALAAIVAGCEGVSIPQLEQEMSECYAIAMSDMEDECFINE